TTGEDVSVLASSVPLRGADGAMLGATVVFRDLGALLERDRERDTFARVVGHEIQVPLTAVRGYIQQAIRQLPSGVDTSLATASPTAIARPSLSRSAAAGTPARTRAAAWACISRVSSPSATAAGSSWNRRHEARCSRSRCRWRDRHSHRHVVAPRRLLPDLSA